MSTEESTQTAATNSNEGCGVDLSWLEGRMVTRVTNDLQNLIIEFEDGLVFKVQALNYKGEPFLAFKPYQDPGQ